MSLRLALRSVACATASVAVFACTSESPLPSAPDGAEALFARGSTPAPSAMLAVGGIWTATTPGGTSVSTDSTRWSLSLAQKDEKLEGSLIRIQYIGGQGFAGVSAVKRGSISGSTVSLEFARGEGAETAPTFGATVSDDGRSMTGFYSRVPGEVTLRRQ